MTFALDEQQRKVWDWWSAESKKHAIYPLLSDEDKQVFSKGVKIQDDETSVVRSRSNFVRIFYEHFSQKDTVVYSQDVVLPVVILKTRQMHSGTMEKPTNPSDVAAYVFSVCLTKDQQNAFRESVFLIDRERSREAVQTYARIYVQYMLELGTLKKEDAASMEAKTFEDRWSKLLESYAK